MSFWEELEYRFRFRGNEEITRKQRIRIVAQKINWKDTKTLTKEQAIEIINHLEKVRLLFENSRKNINEEL